MNDPDRMSALAERRTVAVARRSMVECRMAQDDNGPLVLFYTSFFGKRPPFESWSGKRPCRLTFDRSRLREADVVVFHIPDAWEIGDAIKYPGQVWIAYSMESSAHYPLWRDRNFMRPFDLVMSHERDADIWTPYLPDSQAWQAAVTQPLPLKTERAPVVMFQSATVDRSGRNEFAFELMKRIRVDSYGRLLNNRAVVGPDMGRQTKRDTIARYHFCCAFENASAPDYVTEKIFDPLLAGTIPIYRGAPNVGEFVPEGSYIDAADFPTSAALADHLRHVLQDEAAYAGYFAWRSRPLPPRLAAWLDALTVPLLDRVLAAAESCRASRKAGTGRLPEVPFGVQRYVETKARRLVRAYRQRRASRQASIRS